MKSQTLQRMHRKTSCLGDKADSRQPYRYIYDSVLKSESKIKEITLSLQDTGGAPWPGDDQRRGPPCTFSRWLFCCSHCSYCCTANVFISVPFAAAVCLFVVVVVAAVAVVDD